MKAFFTSGAVLILAVVGIGMSNQMVNEKTMEDCTVHFTTNPFPTTAQATVQTSCGQVYINSHLKNGLFNPGAITKMNEAVLSGKPVDIKSTGFFPAAYEITISK